MNPKVNFFFVKNKKWQNELETLRLIISECNVEEELKWGVPCYTYNQSNIILIHAFKEYCAVLFFKGVLLKDPKGILVQQTKNVQSARQIRFTEIKQIVKLKSTIKSYVREAIEIEISGIKVELKKTSEFEMPEEFRIRLDKSSDLRKAFQSLSPGRQRAYLLHFSTAKQSKTREARIEKNLNRILSGKGLDD